MGSLSLNIVFFLGNDNMSCFWKEIWCKLEALREAFPSLFASAVNKEMVACDWEFSREGEVAGVGVNPMLF